MTNQEDIMQEENAPSIAWIQRCARRLQLRHMVPPPDALEIASVMHEEYGAQSCPERAAEELFMRGEMH